MKITYRQFSVLGLALILAACSGGGGGGVTETSALLSIFASEVQNPLWAGTTIGPPLCGGPVFQNSELLFHFGGAVDPTSLPSGPLADGSVSITQIGGGSVPGAFSVEDDPSLPTGNARRVRFRPNLPGSSAAILTSGFFPGATFNVVLPTTGPDVIRVAGQPLTTSAITCFVTCTPSPTGCFTDPNASAPFVTMTSPETGDPTPAAIPASSFVNSTLSVFFSEPLHPSNINLQTVRLVNTLGGGQVPGTVAFFQAGTPEAGLTGARIDYIATHPLVDGRTYELLLDPAIRDFGNQSVQNYAAGSGGRRLVATSAVAAPPAAPPFIEEFLNISQRASFSGGLLWTSSGVATVPVTSDLQGNGSFGALNYLQPGNYTIDTGVGPSTGYANGVYDTTATFILAGAIVRVIGPRPLHIRAQFGIVISGTLNADAGSSSVAPLGSPEQGPRNGNFNNGQGVNPTIVAGGVGNAGAGSGGRASQGGTVRTLVGEPGFGPSVNGLPTVGPQSVEPSFGGGTGGMGGFRFPNGGVAGELGGLGGAGGSAFSAGSNGGPYSAMFAGCLPITPTVQARALATGITAPFVPPISILSAGSGGGGGGDHFEVVGVAGDDQGGGGGGGGGGLRLSAGADININSQSIISARGVTGGTGNVFFAGAGGGGSGGMIWMQSFSQLTISNAATLQVTPGANTQNCTDFGSGAGGLGVYMLQDADGVVNTAFQGGTGGGTNIIVDSLGLSGQILATADSIFFDTAAFSPDYLGSVEVLSVGNIPGATATVTYQGAHGAVSGTGPDLTTLSAPMSAANLNQLDGYRYIRFSLQLTYLGSNTPPTGAIPPSVDRIEIQYAPF